MTALAVISVASVAILRLRLSVMRTLGLCALLGLVLAVTVGVTA